MNRFKPSVFAVLILVLFLAVLVGIELLLNQTQPEYAELASVQWDEKRYKEYFVSLAERKGGAYAFEILKYAPVAFGVDTHILGHEIGYVLYREKGVAGLAECNDRFSPACAHAVVTQEYIHFGTEALARLTDICLTKPQETMAYWDCFHGIGHGVVAFSSYDFKKGIEECTSLGPLVSSMGFDDSKAVLGCIDGAIMEIFQGQHDVDAWKAQLPVYLPDSDLLMPCNLSYIPDSARPTCFSYMRGRFLHEVGQVGRDILLTPEQYRKAFTYCDLIPEKDVDNRKSCYGGFGVYFGYLVNGNDDRKFRDMTDEQMQKLHEMCGYGPNLVAQSACTFTVAGQIFSEGKGSSGVTRFCHLTVNPILKDRCFTILVSSLSEYPETERQRASICAEVPEAYRASCFSNP